MITTINGDKFTPPVLKATEVIRLLKNATGLVGVITWVISALSSQSFNSDPFIEQFKKITDEELDYLDNFLLSKLANTPAVQGGLQLDLIGYVCTILCFAVVGGDKIADEIQSNVLDALNEFGNVTK